MATRAEENPRSGNMKRHRTIVSTLALLAGCACTPPAALARGPLLSGYGGPGAGAQTILGATLLGGGGSAGGSSGGGSQSTGGGIGVEGSSAPGAGSANGRSERAPGGRAGRGSTQAGGAAAGAHPRAAGAKSKLPHLLGTAQAASSEQEGSWFSAIDLLVLVLVSGALAIVALATLRLARTEHH
jgi:hypothetical protein